ncbi:unnamed protein product [Fraxinus pennsylvanica]|uniref:Uncharacterized protein n=1 Tax=Fraxinus pennsylvanica TaxID=56036 RepID=A0AAD2A761_9LAMI|nr:unnamed protein product [Fraxinus pennsylvanica]
MAPSCTVGCPKPTNITNPIYFSSMELAPMQYGNGMSLFPPCPPSSPYTDQTCCFLAIHTPQGRRGLKPFWLGVMRTMEVHDVHRMFVVGLSYIPSGGGEGGDWMCLSVFGGEGHGTGVVQCKE